MASVWQRILAGLRWVYDWITVIAGLCVGLPSVLLDLLNALGAVDITPFVGPEKALQIVTGIAITKALLAFIEGRISK